MPPIQIPDVEPPTATLCWKQNYPTPDNPAPTHAMVRCDRKAGHTGPHSFEYPTTKAAQ